MIHFPEQFFVLDANVIDVVERPQNVGIGLQTESAEEDSAIELTFTVDTDVEEVLVVVLELDPLSRGKG